MGKTVSIKSVAVPLKKVTSNLAEADPETQATATKIARELLLKLNAMQPGCEPTTILTTAAEKTEDSVDSMATVVSNLLANVNDCDDFEALQTDLILPLQTAAADGRLEGEAMELLEDLFTIKTLKTTPTDQNALSLPTAEVQVPGVAAGDYADSDILVTVYSKFLLELLYRAWILLFKCVLILNHN